MFKSEASVRLSSKVRLYFFAFFQCAKVRLYFFRSSIMFESEASQFVCAKVRLYFFRSSIMFESEASQFVCAKVRLYFFRSSIMFESEASKFGRYEGYFSPALVSDHTPVSESR